MRNTARRTKSSIPTRSEETGSAKNHAVHIPASAVATSPGPSPPYQALHITATKKIVEESGSNG